MPENTQLSRIQHLRGTTKQWESFGDIVTPKSGELVIETDDSGYNRLKIGNGVTTYKELPYLDDKVLRFNDDSQEISDEEQRVLRNKLDIVQPDWTEDDPSKSAYIKNKPQYILDDKVLRFNDETQWDTITLEEQQILRRTLGLTSSGQVASNYNDLQNIPILNKYNKKNEYLHSWTSNDIVNNKVYSNYAVALGTNTTAGSNAFKIIAVDTENLTMTLNSINGLTTGLECSCQYSSNFDLFGTITAIDTENNIVTFSVLPSDVFTEGQTNVLWVPSNPELGDGETIIGDEAFATGYNNKSSQVGSFAAGGNNNAAGKYSAVFGENNKAGYCSAVFGQYNNGHQWSLVGGYQNTLTAPFAFSAGGNNTVSAQYGNALGHGNTVDGEASFITGQSSTINSKNSLSSGVNNLIDINAKESIAAGSGNKIYAPHSVALGFKNIINASSNGRSTALGSENIIGHNYCATFGKELQTGTDNQIIVGRQNVVDENAVFIVANGTANTGTSNAFTVKKDGSAEVKIQGITDNSVATKGYVDNNIDTATSQCNKSFRHISTQLHESHRFQNKNFYYLPIKINDKCNLQAGQQYQIDIDILWEQASSTYSDINIEDFAISHEYINTITQNGKISQDINMVDKYFNGPNSFHGVYNRYFWDNYLAQGKIDYIDYDVVQRYHYFSTMSSHTIYFTINENISYNDTIYITMVYSRPYNSGLNTGYTYNDFIDIKIKPSTLIDNNIQLFNNIPMEVSSYSMIEDYDGPGDHFYQINTRAYFSYTFYPGIIYKFTFNMDHGDFCNIQNNGLTPVLDCGDGLTYSLDPALDYWQIFDENGSWTGQYSYCSLSFSVDKIISGTMSIYQEHYINAVSSLEEAINKIDVQTLSFTLTKCTNESIDNMLSIIYPIGSIYITSDQHLDPAELFGGQWELIDKEFYAYGESNPAFFSAAANVVTNTCTAIRSGHTLHLSAHITVNSTLSETDMVLGSFNFDLLGVKSLSVGYIGLRSYSDGANGGVIFDLAHDTGIVTQRDLFDVSTIASGNSFYIEVTTPIIYTCMLDGVCNKFYWKRIG